MIISEKTARERLETMQTACKDVISSLLVVLDDAERAEKQLQVSQDIEEIRRVSCLFSTSSGLRSSQGV